MLVCIPPMPSVGLFGLTESEHCATSHTPMTSESRQHVRQDPPLYRCQSQFCPSTFFFFSRVITRCCSVRGTRRKEKTTSFFVNTNQRWASGKQPTHQLLVERPIHRRSILLGLELGEVVVPSNCRCFLFREDLANLDPCTSHL